MLYFIAYLAAPATEHRVNLTQYHALLELIHRRPAEVTPAKRDKGVKLTATAEVCSLPERHLAISLTQRFDRLINIDIASRQ
jgi:hypothetical protein